MCSYVVAMIPSPSAIALFGRSVVVASLVSEMVDNTELRAFYGQHYNNDCLAPLECDAYCQAQEIVKNS